MLLLVLAAHASPLAPAATQRSPLTVEVSATVTTEREWLFAKGCEPSDTASCAVVRAQARQGGEVKLRIVEPIALYARLDRVHEKTRAATYEGLGYGGDVGVNGGVTIHDRWGVDGWVEYALRRTDTVDTATGAQGVDDAQRQNLDVGVALRQGVPDQGFQTWLAAEVTPWVSDSTRVVGGEVNLGLVPMFPVTGTVGIRAISPGLSGYGSDRGRVSVGVSGSLGYRTGVTGWVGAAF